MNACVGGFDDTLIGLCASAVEKLGEGQSLGIKSPTLFRCSDSKWHKIFPPAQNFSLGSLYTTKPERCKSFTCQSPPKPHRNLWLRQRLRSRQARPLC